MRIGEKVWLDNEHFTEKEVLDIPFTLPLVLPPTVTGYLFYFQTLMGKVLFEISIPNYAFRNLDLSTGKMVRIALREESLWVMV